MVISINGKMSGRVALIIVILATGTWIGYTAIHVNTPVRIGNLFALAGDVEFPKPLEWAKDTINNESGMGGRKVELRYKDITTGNDILQA